MIGLIARTPFHNFLKLINHYFLDAQTEIIINSFLASGNFCCLPITFANSLTQDQDRHVGPDLDLNCLTLR